MYTLHVLYFWRIACQGRLFLVSSRCWGRTYGHRPVIIKRAMIVSKGGWLAPKVGGSSAQYLSCKVFRGWSIIKLREKK